MNRFFVLFFILLTIGGGTLFSNSKYDKKIRQVEEQILAGNLKKAEKNVAKLLKKGARGLGKGNYAKLMLYKGQVQAYKQSPFEIFNNYLNQGEVLMKSSSLKNKMALCYLVKAKSYYSAGYIEKSLYEIEKLEEEKLGPALVSEKDFLLVKNYLLIGEYSKAQELMKQMKATASSLNKIKISNLEVLLEMKRGDYLKAERYLNEVEKVIFGGKEATNYEIIDYFYLLGKFHYSNNKQNLAVDYLEKAYNLSRSRDYPLFYSEHVSTKEEIAEDFTYVLELMHNDKYAFEVAKEYLSKLKKMTGKGIFYEQMRNYHLLKFEMLQEQYADVIEEVAKLEESSPEMFNNPLFQLALDELVLDCYYNQLEFFQAEKYIKQLMPLYQKVYGKENLHLSKLKLDLGRLYAREMGLFDQAAELYNSKDYERVNNELAYSNKDLIYYNEVYSDIKLGQEEFVEAKKVLKPHVNFLAEYYKGNENEILARIYVHYAKVLIAMGEYKDANYYLETARGIYDNIYHDVIDYEYMLKVTGSFYMELSYYEEAIALLEEAERVSKDFGDELSVDELSEFAVLYIKTGRFKGIEDLLLEIIEEKKTLKQSMGSIVPEYNKLAELYLIQGKYSDVENCIRQVNDLTDEEFKKSLKYAETLNLEAQFYLLIGDFQKANSLFTKVRVRQEELLPEGHPKIAYTIQEECITQLALGDTEGVEDKLRKASNIIKVSVGPDTRAYAESLKKLGVYYTQVKRYLRAEKSLEDAYEILETYGKKVKKNESLAETCLYLGNVKREKKDIKASTYYFKKSLNAYKKIFGVEHPKYLHVVGELAKLEVIKGNELKAIELLEESTNGYLTYINEYFPTLTEREKSKFWSLMKSDFEYFNALALRNYDKKPQLIGEVYNDLLVTKSLLLNSSIEIRKKILQSGDEELIEKFDLWLLRKTELMLVLTKTKEELEAEGIDQNDLVQEVNQLERYLGKKVDYLHFKKETWQDIQSELGSKEVAVEILRYVEVAGKDKGAVKYAAFIIKNDKDYRQPKVVLLDDGQKMETNYFAHYRNSLLYMVEDKLSYDRYWSPIERHLTKGDKVYLSPDGVYMLMNLEALKDKGGSYVLDKNDIILVGNTRDVLADKSKLKRTKKALLLGDPLFYEGNKKGRVQQLPGTNSEVKTLGNVLSDEDWGVSPFIQKEASEDKLLGENNYQVIHIATHGFFNEEEVHSEEMTELGIEYNNSLFQSGLILANGGELYESHDKMHEQNGILTSYEALNLKLDQVDLVVLSACETGVGDVQNGEGVYGLQRSFLIAGAKNVIMSLYKVSDEVTAELMIEFYKAWVKGKSKHEALIIAKTKVRKKYPNPYYWSGFVIIGIDE